MNVTCCRRALSWDKKITGENEIYPESEEENIQQQRNSDSILQHIKDVERIRWKNIIKP